MVTPEVALLAATMVLLCAVLARTLAGLRLARHDPRAAWAHALEPFVRHASDLTAVVDRDGRIRYQSPSHERLLGHPAGERIGTSAFDLVHPDDLPEAQRTFAALLSEPGATRRVTLRVSGTGGAWVVLEAVAFNLLDDPTVAGIIVNSRDLTELCRAKQRQATQLAVARALAEAPSVAAVAPRILEAIGSCAGWDLGEMWVVDEASSVLRWHGHWHAPGVHLPEFEALSRETSFPRGRGLPGRVWAGRQPLWHADVARDEDFVRHTAAAREGLHAALAFPVLCRGEVGGVLAFYSREVREPDEGLVAMMADVGLKVGDFVERKRAEAALRESELRSRAVLETAADGIVTIDERGIVDSINPAAARLFGYEIAEVVGRNVSMLMPPPHREEHDAHLARYRESGEARVIGIGREVPGLRRDGTRIPLELSLSEVRLPGRRLFTGILRDVSERKRAEQALRESEERFQRLADASFEGVAIHEGGIVIDANDRLAALYGGPREELLGRPLMELVAPESRARVAEQVASGSETPYEARVLCRDGTSFLAEASGRGILYKGRPARIVAVRDITDRRRQEDALRESEARYRRLMDEASDGLLILDPDGERVAYANTRLCEILGYEREEALALRLGDMLPPGELEEQPIRWGDLRAGRLTLTERQMRRKDGRLVPVEISGKMLGDGRLQALVRDISERKRAEARDATQFAVTRILTEASDLGAATPRLLEAICEGMSWDVGELWTADDDADGRHLVRRGSWGTATLDLRGFEQASQRMTFGYADGLPGRVWAAGEPAWVFDVTRERWFRRREAATRTGRRGAVGFPIVGSAGVNGVMVFLSARVRPPEVAVLREMADIGKQIGHFIERKRAEREALALQRAVRRSANEWRLTFDTIGSPIVVVDAEGRLVRLNRVAQEASGRSFDELLGRPIASLGGGEPWRIAANLAAAVVAGGAPLAADARDDATGRTWDVAATPLPRGQSREQRVILVARDVTRIVELQESLRRSETLSAMGSLVAGVAHEVRNPLFGISSNLDAFEARFGDREECSSLVTVLRQQVGRLRGLAQELLDYGRLVRVEMCPGALEEVVSRAVDACRPLATAEGVRIAVELQGETLPPIRMDRDRLARVFQNLIENAIQHSPPGSVVRVTGRALPRADQSWIECAVEDSGPGFREADLPRVLEPFFTRRRGGTGLGLSIVARIVEEHAGHLKAGNRPGGGAVMTVRLPGSGIEASGEP